MESKNKNISINDEEKIKNTISSVLLKSGTPAHLKGFIYLKEAIYIVYKCPERIQTMTRGLYPELGVKYNRSPQSVERAIRTCLQELYKGDLQELSHFFGYKIEGPQPNNARFIAEFSERLHIISCASFM